jgi:hypothetical protein
VLRTLNQHDSNFVVAAFNKEDRFPIEGVVSLQIIAGPVGVPIREEEKKRYFNGARKEKVVGRKMMQVLLGQNMWWDVINEDVVAELNHLSHHMWWSEVQTEEDGMNLQMEDNSVENLEDLESAEDRNMLHKSATREK